MKRGVSRSWMWARMRRAIFPQARRAAGLVAVVVVLGGPGGGLADGDRVPGPVPARLVSVIDGDTIEVEALIWVGQAVVTRVRLLGIDAPERNGACSRERIAALLARDTLAVLIEGWALSLHDVQLGKYAGRVLARVETGAGLDVGAALLDRGLVRAYDGGARGTWC